MYIYQKLWKRNEPQKLHWNILSGNRRFYDYSCITENKKKQKENEIEFRDKIQDLYWISNEMSPGLSNLIIRERIQRKESKLINNDYYYGCVQMKKKKTS